MEVKRHTHMYMGGGSQPGDQVVHVNNRAFDLRGIFPELWLDMLGDPKVHDLVSRIR